VSKDYKCGRCGTIFTLDEYNRLRTIKPQRRYQRSEGLITRIADEDLKSFYVCRCGYTFNRQNWHLNNRIVIGDPKTEVRLSTIFAEVNLGSDDAPLWYETRVRGVKCKFRRRYSVKRDAIKGHNEVFGLLKEQHFTLTPQVEGPPLLVVIEHPVFDKAAAVREEVGTK